MCLLILVFWLQGKRCDAQRGGVRIKEFAIVPKNLCKSGTHKGYFIAIVSKRLLNYFNVNLNRKYSLRKNLI
jgi:hypothetical protein